MHDQLFRSGFTTGGRKEVWKLWLANRMEIHFLGLVLIDTIIFQSDYLEINGNVYNLVYSNKGMKEAIFTIPHRL